jgi:transposase
VRYLGLLQEELYTTLIDFDFDLGEVIFQADNASVHKAKIVHEWFWEQPYSMMDWLAQSPDLNPIEHVWSILKRRLNLYSTPPKNLHELWNHVQEVYATITIDECQRLYASMLAQIAAMEAKGRWTSF